MPHFGLIDEDALGPEQGALLRARLHWRSAKRRLREGKLQHGLATLQDALSCAMQYYLASPRRRQGLRLQGTENLADDRTAYQVLVRSGLLSPQELDYQRFDQLLEEAFQGKEVDYRWALKAVQKALLRLGVLPFDEEELPPEAPGTL
jgi:hypothetical protein